MNTIWRGIVLVILGCLVQPHSMILAWGSIGHEVIGKIAERHLNRRTAERVQVILGTESLARASNWADEVRSEPAYDYTEPWHFSTAPLPQKNPGQDSEPHDLLTALTHLEKRLTQKGLNAEQQREALRLLVHFVGDLHQPLHISGFDDTGANRCMVTWFGDVVRLHAVWDDLMIDSLKLSYTELVDFIDHPTTTQIKEWQQGTYLNWAQESLDAHAEIYPPPKSRNYCKKNFGDFIPREKLPQLSYKYRYTYRPLLEMRLLQAGVRLAAVLNRLLSK